MSAILSQAQTLISGLQALMPSAHQQDSLQALLGRICKVWMWRNELF